MSKDEHDPLITQLQGEVLEVFNKRLIRAGINEGVEAIYIASMAIAQAAAVLIWSQLPLNGITPEEREGLLNDWCELYKQYSRELLEKRMLGHNGEPITKANMKEGLDTEEDGDIDDNPWSRKEGISMEQPPSYTALFCKRQNRRGGVPYPYNRRGDKA